MLTTLQCILTVCSIATVSYKVITIRSLRLLLSHYIAGPTVDSNMKLSLFTPRDTETNITFTLSFTVSCGPPSACSRNGAQFLRSPLCSRPQ